MRFAMQSPLRQLDPCYGLVVARVDHYGEYPAMEPYSYTVDGDVVGCVRYSWDQHLLHSDRLDVAVRLLRCARIARVLRSLFYQNQIINSVRGSPMATRLFPTFWSG
jgi:hypothetical protein